MKAKTLHIQANSFVTKPMQYLPQPKLNITNTTLTPTIPNHTLTNAKQS